MAYHLRYVMQFDSTAETPCKVELWQKDNPSTPLSITGSGRPAVQQWQEDNINAPIRGCKLTVGYLNAGSLPLTTFYSNNDDEWKAIMYVDNNKVFEGLLLQDDCTEDMVDYNHEVTLVFTDNLGLLKDIPFSEALSQPLIYIPDNFEVTTAVAGTDTAIIAPSGIIEAGETISIYDLTGRDYYGTFTVLSVTGGNTYVLDGPLPLLGGLDSIIIRHKVYGAAEKIMLLSIVHGCLKQTGLELPVKLYCNLAEITQSFNFTFMTQTLINRETFLVNEDEYDTCWNVLEKLFKPLRLSLYQSGGEWIIRKWDEVNYLSPINYYLFSADFFFLRRISEFVSYHTVGLNMPTYPEVGLNRRIERPYEFARETFNYQTPRNVLKNANLQDIGALIRTYIDGSGRTVKEYEFTWWREYNFGTPVPERFIRVVEDGSGNEIERYAVVKGNTFDSARSVESTPIEVVTGDVIRYSFSYRTGNSTPGPNTTNFAVRVQNGSNTYYADEVNGWQAGLGWTFQISTGDNGNDWHSVEIVTEPSPIDGLVSVFLAEAAGATPPHETHYKDLALDIDFTINSSTKIRGHVHTDRQDIVIKNNLDETIHIDDSPRNSISGTLFLNLTSSSISRRTTLWRKYDADAEQQKLGQIATIAALFQRGHANTIMEGDFHGLVQNGVILSPNILVKYIDFPSQLFIFGRMEIDYRWDMVRGTLYQVKDDNIDFHTFADEYTFRYLYSTK